jgi:hypothetical protein
MNIPYLEYYITGGAFSLFLGLFCYWKYKNIPIEPPVDR